MKTPSKGTTTGYHFISGFQDCPRRWYLTYAVGLQPETKPSALGFGSAIHYAREAYYTLDRQRNALLEGFDLGMNAEKATYEPDKYEADLSRGFNLLATWLRTWHEEDLVRYIVKEVEVEHQVPLPGLPGVSLTIRPDLVMYDTTTGETYAFDCKTTSWSVGQAYHQVDTQDQATAYIWGLRKVHPTWRVQGLIVDVLYNKGSVYKAERPGVVYRTESDLAEWEGEATGVIGDITQRMEALTTGKYPTRHLFPRNGSYCARYGCSYESVCRQSIKVGDCPIGFTVSHNDATPPGVVE